MHHHICARQLIYELHICTAAEQIMYAHVPSSPAKDKKIGHHAFLDVHILKRRPDMAISAAAEKRHTYIVGRSSAGLAHLATGRQVTMYAVTLYARCTY